MSTCRPLATLFLLIEFTVFLDERDTLLVTAINKQILKKISVIRVFHQIKENQKIAQRSMGQNFQN